MRTLLVLGILGIILQSGVYNANAQYCRRVGEGCTWGSDCCSGDCTFRNCRGSAKDCAWGGQACTWGKECCSGDCSFRTCRGSPPPQQWGHPYPVAVPVTPQVGFNFGGARVSFGG